MGMNENPKGGWMNTYRRGLAAVLLLGVLAVVGCSHRTAPATDSKSLKEHAAELKKQHQREMHNK